MTATAYDHLQPPSPGFVAAAVVSLGLAAVAAVAVAVTGTPLPLALVLLLVFAVLLMTRPDIGTYLFLGLLWINVPAVLTQFHNVPGVLANSLALLLFIPVGRYLLARKSVVVTPALFAILLFLAANMLSAAFSQSPDTGWARIQTFLAEGLLVYLLVTNAVRTPRILRGATWILVLAAVFMGGLSVHQELTQAYRDPYFGFAQTTRQDDPLSEQPRADSRPRMMGPIGEQNRYAQTLLVILPLALYGLRLRSARWRLAIGIPAALIITAGVLLTFSRGAAVALVMLLLVLVIWRYVRLRHMVAMACAFLLTVLLIAPEFLARVDSITAASELVTGEGEGPDNAILGRATSNLAALLVFVDYPITGVGPAVYSTEFSIEYANELGLRHFGQTRRAHNMYLEWAADLGVIGLVTGLSMLAVTMVQLARARRYWRWRRPDYANLAGAYWLALVAYTGTAIFLHLSYERYFFTLLGLANAAIWILARERVALEATVTNVDNPPPNGGAQRFRDEPLQRVPTLGVEGSGGLDRLPSAARL